MGGDLVLHFNLPELIWTLVAALGLWTCIQLLLDSYRIRSVVRHNDWNGVRLLAANASLRRNRIRVIIMFLMTSVGILSGMFPSDHGEDIVSIVAVTSLLLIGILVVLNAVLDRRDDSRLRRQHEALEDAVQER